MMTFSNIAEITTTAAMAGAQAQAGSGMGLMSKSEMQAAAIGKVAEANIIQPKEKKGGLEIVVGRNNKNRNLTAGLSKETHQTLGKMGRMTAMTRAGVNPGGMLSLKV